VARENLIRVSDEEKELVECVRQSEFKTEEVPLGVAISVACNEYLEQ